MVPNAIPIAFLHAFHNTASHTMAFPIRFSLCYALSDPRAIRFAKTRLRKNYSPSSFNPIILAFQGNCS